MTFSQISPVTDLINTLNVHQPYCYFMISNDEESFEFKLQFQSCSISTITCQVFSPYCVGREIFMMFWQNPSGVQLTSLFFFFLRYRGFNSRPYACKCSTTWAIPSPFCFCFIFSVRVSSILPRALLGPWSSHLHHLCSWDYRHVSPCPASAQVTFTMASYPLTSLQRCCLRPK
jgi:hypothetical protein